MDAGHIYGDACTGEVSGYPLMKVFSSRVATPSCHASPLFEPEMVWPRLAWACVDSRGSVPFARLLRAGLVTRSTWGSFWGFQCLQGGVEMLKINVIANI